ncbi:cytochrome P450 2A13-like isoform X2 [Ambystoma mexicanum]|uniref:cytochrome P450 2A13-like isoform X2 n=1 Tax=Ambystoma mexicanum TaxID=8296 RepID=UPI0037E719F6
MFLAGELTVYLYAVTSVLLFLYFWRIYDERSRLPPGPFPLPLIGNLHQINTGDMVNSLKALSRKYGPVFTLHLGMRRVVMLWGYDAVKEALVDQGEEFSGRGPVPIYQLVMKDYGPTFSNGERWKEMRRFALMTLRNFGMGKRSIEERVQEEAYHLIDALKKTKGLPFDPAIQISNSVSNVICSVIFGKRFEYHDKEFVELLHRIHDTTVISSSLGGQLYTMYTGIMKYLPGSHRTMYKVITDLETFVKKRVKINQETIDPNSPRDFIDCFLIKMGKDKGNPSTEYCMKNLVISVLTLFMAGTETVSTTIKHSLLLIKKHPEIEARILAEIDSVIGRDRLPTIVDRRRMPYTDAVIHEIQRFSDIVPFGVPHIVIRDTKFRRFMLPKGTEIYPILSSVLSDSAKFEDPENFDPGHFLDENGCFKNNDAFMPFSTGKRICLGEGLAQMELFIYITTILQKFKLQFPCDPKDIDIKPRLSGFFNVPISYELQAIPH